ncbi:MAG TPA: alkaline phosphatase family protein [Anaerolineales bacterium]|nr:alkaline phosphatase family protein [Anaerolineales bacterium]
MKHRLHKPLLVLISLFLLLACQIPVAAGVPSIPLVSTDTAVPSITATLSATPTVAPTPLPSATPTATALKLSTATFTATVPPRVRRVVIVSIDGLRPDAIFPAPMPTLITLMQTGAYSLGAQTVFPSITLTAHSSMLSGLCPSKHGVYWNEFIPENGHALGTNLFDLTHAAGLKTVMYVGKQKLSQVTEASSLDKFIYIDDSDSVLMGSLTANFPEDFGILFIHLLATDTAGHDYGWLSPEQLSVIRGADGALGMLVAELDARNLRSETLIIVTSDHGGSGGSHGSDAREDMTIPWVISGPGIQPKTLTTQIHTIDTAATAAFALGLTIPAEWDGVPVYEAFGLPVERQSVQCP